MTVKKMAVKQRVVKKDVDGKIDIEILNCKEIHDRIIVEAKINDEEFINCDFPKSFGKDTDYLLNAIKSQYTTHVANCKIGALKVRSDVIGSHSV